jgi:hypothetical protein
MIASDRVAEKSSVCRRRGSAATIRLNGGRKRHIQHPIRLVKREHIELLKARSSAAADDRGGIGADIQCLTGVSGGI